MVIDPRNGVEGEIKDVWIRDGRIVAPPAAAEQIAARRIDVTGRVVMPGAVDMHCHIAGPKVNTARMMHPEKMRLASDRFAFDAPMSCVPDIYTAGMRYTGLGYTSCFDAAVAPLASKMVLHELDVVPNVDKGFYVLVGNNHFAMQAIANSDNPQLKDFIGWLLSRCQAYALKLVNPGGVEKWKQTAKGNVRDLDETVDGFGISPRQIINGLTCAANEMGLPHPVHIHCNNLGVPGNFETTLETMRLVQGHRAHLAHIQFHSYGGGGVDEGSLCSKVQELADFVNSNPELTVDVGQVMFGETINMTADGPLGYYLHSIGGEKWFSADLELESGCGVSPIHYKNQSFVHSLQWAIGLEWYLSVNDPWQIAMSSDHPNGGSFLAYPQIIRLLMDASYRREQLDHVNPRVLKHSALKDIEREYTLCEIAIITRAGPARILGLEQKGHLGIGADADIAVYTPEDNYATMFAWPYMVIKSGNLLMENGEFRQAVTGNLLESRPSFDQDHGALIEEWFEDRYSISMREI